MMAQRRVKEVITLENEETKDSNKGKMYEDSS